MFNSFYSQMEVLFFALFFITSLIFFIAGKDDFGRTENKFINNGKEKVKKEVAMEPKTELKEEA